jgi:hypothetical protein
MSRVAQQNKTHCIARTSSARVDWFIRALEEMLDEDGYLARPDYVLAENGTRCADSCGSSLVCADAPSMEVFKRLLRREAFPLGARPSIQT